MAMHPSRVVLSECELKIAEYLGNKRHRENRDAGVADKRVADDALQIDIDGAGAELAFSKLFNVYPDLDTHLRRGSIDCVWLGSTVDVKGTRYRSGKLLALPHKQTLSADYFALFVVDRPAYQFVGLASAEDLFRLDRLTRFNHQTTYLMEQHELTPAAHILGED